MNPLTERSQWGDDLLMCRFATTEKKKKEGGKGTGNVYLWDTRHGGKRGEKKDVSSPPDGIKQGKEGKERKKCFFLL